MARTAQAGRIEVGQVVRVVDLNPVVLNRRPSLVGEVIAVYSDEAWVEIGGRHVCRPLAALRVLDQAVGA